MATVAPTGSQCRPGSTDAGTVDPEIDAKLEQMKADMEQGVKAKDAKFSRIQ
ncbi:MAG: hypothetical protein ACLSFT_00415 [Ruminococcus callidus]